MPGRTQIDQGGAHANAIDIVERTGGDAVGIRMVLIRVLGKPQVHAGVIKGLRGRQPFLSLVAADGNRTFVAMKIATGEVQVVFQPAEVRQHLDERPLVVAPGGPVVVVLGHPPKQHLAIDGAGAPGSPAPGDLNRLRLQGCRRCGVAPIVGAVGGAPHIVAIFQVDGQVLEFRVVGTSLQKEDGSAGIF